MWDESSGTSSTPLVQTGNFELREISRYQVALKVSRTSKGVPLLEDIPIMGALFRPAPSDESSLQQNVIYGQTNLYPTLYDLMGLRWAQQVVDLDHTSLMESEHVIRGRQKSMNDYVFRVASERVDEFLDVKTKASRSYRPDLYHEQTLSSPYHPGGYNYPLKPKDPTGNGFERIDRRPPDMQEPPFERYRHRPVHPENIGPPADEYGVFMQEDPQRVTQQFRTQTLPVSHPNYNLQKLPQADLQQFESLLLQGPTDSADQRRGPQFNDGARSSLYEPRMAPAQPHNTSLGVVHNSRRLDTGLQASRTVPQFRPTPSATHKVPARHTNSGVVPASFEQSKVLSRARVRRLPPVMR